MLVRIGVALGALYCMHGGDHVAQDGAALAQSARENAPKAAITLCLDHATQCANLGGTLVGAQAAKLAVGLEHVSQKCERFCEKNMQQNIELEHVLDSIKNKRALMAVNVPQPPRKSPAIGANSPMPPIKTLDREGLNRAVQTRG
jgi:hypothetical protein